MLNASEGNAQCEEEVALVSCPRDSMAKSSQTRKDLDGRFRPCEGLENHVAMVDVGEDRRLRARVLRSTPR